MFENRRKRHLLASFSTLFLLAFGAGCTGFFVDPTLTGIQVGPTASIQQTKTLQESATGTFDDGTTKVLSNSSGVVWSVADVEGTGTNVATISPSGLVTGTSPGQATVTGSVGSVSGSSTVTVTLTGITSIQVTPQTATVTAGSSQTFVAKANGGETVITASVNWLINAGSVTGVNIDPTTGIVTTTVGDTGVVTITATDPGTGKVSNTVTLTID